MSALPFRSGFIAIVGCPNTGKSTLLNALVGEKVAIVSPRPQTTRNRLMGVACGDGYQMVFVDTPGIHTPRTRLGAYMMQSVREGLEGIDALLVVIDCADVGEQDARIAGDMAQKEPPAFLALNKIDLVPPPALLRVIDRFKDMGFAAILPVSARRGDGLDTLRGELLARMPQGPKYFPDDMLTDQPERLICAELIREKALNHLRDEVPHGLGVEILGMKTLRDGLMEIHADIYCERDAHKGIIIGKHGAMLTVIGREARVDIESLLGVRVNLQLWVRVRPNWRNSIEDLRTLGYESSAK